jgi:hypothetical protein
MNKSLLLGFAALTIGFAAPAFAQEAPPTPPQGEEEEDEAYKQIQFKRVNSVSEAGKSADVPTTGGTIHVSEKEGTPPPPEQPDVEVPDPNDVPDPETPDEEPPVEDEEPPTFFGEPVSGNFVFCLDRSGSMGAQDPGSGPIEDPVGGIISSPNRIQIVKSEAIKVLNQLTENDEFAIVSFGAGPEWAWYPARVQATSGNVQVAVSEISQLNASGATPAYTALHKSCTLYNAGDGLDKIYFLCDGSPNSDSQAPGGNGSASAILGAFPQWWQSGPEGSDCTLVCVHIGTSGAAGQFMQALAGLAGGIYTHH